MNFKKWVKSIQTVGYNGAYTVTKVRVAINSWISTLVDACCLRHMWLCIYFMKKNTLRYWQSLGKLNKDIPTDSKINCNVVSLFVDIHGYL